MILQVVVAVGQLMETGSLPFHNACFQLLIYTVTNFRSLSFPAICPEDLLGNKAFCANHCIVAEDHSYPTDIRSFVKFQKEAGIMYTAHSLLS